MLLNDAQGKNSVLWGGLVFPTVVLTALTDDTVGAGLDPNGAPQNDTDNTPRRWSKRTRPSGSGRRTTGCAWPGTRGITSGSAGSTPR